MKWAAWRRRAAALCCLSVATAVFLPDTAHAAGMTVQCLSGCFGAQPDGRSDRSLNLILRESEQDSIKLRWMTSEPPASEGETLRLFAGNPTHADQLTDLGILSFDQSGSRWAAVYAFEGAQLGGGTLITVVVREQGSKREIADWHAFRLLTTAERAREVAGPPAGDERSISLWPVAMRADSSHGPLPPATGGDRAAWWSLVDAQDRLTDLDLDGESNGAPGLGIQVSPPWEAGTGSAGDPRQGLKDLLSGVDGHTVVMGDLRWVEQAPAEASILTDAGRADVQLKHYYTVVTLFSSASVRALSRQDLVDPKLFTQRAFAHETSARTNSPPDPAVWASYSIREYSADPQLLSLIVDPDRRVPGLTGVLRTEGDGGPTAYQVGFKIRVKPWETGGSRRYTRAGLVGVDVVAARVGHGTVRTRGSAGESDARRALDRLLGKDGEQRALDLDDPPDGFATAPVTAGLLTRSGGLPLLKSELELAQRGEETEVFPTEAGAAGGGTLERLRALVDRVSGSAPAAEAQAVLDQLEMPTEGRFVLSANLRAGALVEKGGLLARQPLSLIPINGYAQFVLKLTVAMLPDASIVASTGAILPRESEHGVDATLDRRGGIEAPKVGAGGRITIIAVVVGILAIVLVILIFAVPGFRQFLGGWLRVLTPRSRPDDRGDRPG